MSQFLITKLIVVCEVIIATCLLSIQNVQSHPHVFIIQRLTVQFDEKGLAGIKVRWKMDDMFASMIAEEHDFNQNGMLEENEVQSVKEKAFMFIGEQNFFTFIKIDNHPFDVKFIKYFNAVLEDQGLVYEFVVPCHVTASNQMKKVSVASYDPSYYTAIFFAKNNPVSTAAADGFELKTAIREDQDTAIYYDMIHPWTLFMEFRRKA